MTTNLVEASITRPDTSTTRTFGDRLSDYVNVKDFGAVGDNSTNDTTAIQAAITAALSSGTTLRGGTVFFPPGIYRISTPLVTSGVSGQTSVVFRGSGFRNSMLAVIASSAADDDYIINKQYNDGNIAAIHDLYFQGGFGCLNIIGSQSLRIVNCWFSGYHGIVNTNETYGTVIEGCSFDGGAEPGSAAVIAAASVKSCRMVGWDIGICAGGYGHNIFANSIETGRVGVLIGAGPLQTNGVDVSPKYEISSITWNSGTSQAIVNTTAAHGLSAQKWVYILGTVPVGYSGFFQVDSVDDADTFRFTLRMDPGGAASTPGFYRTHNFFNAAFEGSRLSGIQTERLQTHIDVWNTANSSITDCKLTSTIGPGQWEITNIAWSGGVATVTTAEPHMLLVGETITIEDNTFTSPWAVQVGRVIVSTPTTTTFTFNSANLGSPNGNELFTRLPLHGIRVRNASRLELSNITTPATCTVAALDLAPAGTEGYSTIYDLTINNCFFPSSGAGVEYGNTIDGIRFHPACFGSVKINGIHPPCTFKQLPGASGVNGLADDLGEDQSNEEFQLTDSPTNTPGAIVRVGGGHHHVKVKADSQRIAISSITNSSGTVTVTTAVPHNLVTGQCVHIEQVSDSFNGPAFHVFWPITVSSATVFTYSDTNTMSNISGDGTTVTVTTATRPRISRGESVTIYGVTPSGYNGGPFTVTEVFEDALSGWFKYSSATTGTMTVAGNFVSASTPTIGQMKKPPDAGDATLVNISNMTAPPPEVTTSANHNLAVDDEVLIKNVSKAFNGLFTVLTVLSSTAFRYTDTRVSGTPPVGFVRPAQYVVVGGTSNEIPFASLPSAPTTGVEYNVSDSNTTTWGATVAGGGSNHVKARYNGTNWTVVGI